MEMKGTRSIFDHLDRLWETGGPLSRLWLKGICVPLVDGWLGSSMGDRARGGTFRTSEVGIGLSSFLGFSLSLLLRDLTKVVG